MAGSKPGRVLLSLFAIVPAAPSNYVGRIAPSPTGLLHLGHARTFWIAEQRARAVGGRLILRIEDLDGPRCKAEFAAACLEDLFWLGLDWNEGPDVGGPNAPYEQSRRLDLYREPFERLQQSGHLYPCACSRKDILAFLSAPHEGDEEPVYPGTCRSRAATSGEKVSWRFRVPDGEVVTFIDGNLGPHSFMAGRDFGDFVVWRHDGIPSYQLAVVADDALMGVTEVVRGEDLLVSTARQLLLYRALGWSPPAFYHCALMRDEAGARLAKRHASLSLRALREQGATPAELLARFQTKPMGPP
jgi:glutamyl/glutaminyl-tRNA synthetase